MNRSTRILVTCIACIYILSPFDMFPGPVDDALLAVLTWYFTTRHTGRDSIEDRDRN